MAFVPPVSAHAAPPLARAAAPPPPPPRPAERPRARKPPGYWTDPATLVAELRRFRRAHASRPSAAMPTAAELLAAGRADLCRAVQRHGGFAVSASHSGLQATRAPRRPRFTPGPRVAVPTGLLAGADAPAGLLLPRKPPPFPFEIHLRDDRLREGALRDGQAVCCGAQDEEAGARVGSERSSGEPDREGVEQQALAGERRRKRRERGHWASWRRVEAAIRAFAAAHSGGYMPKQRELLRQGRADLVNAVRMHGGQTSVARRAGLEPAPRPGVRRTRGYWANVAVLHAELLTFTATNGHPGLMPRREHLLRAGRSDLCYAIEKYGGYSTVAARLHLVWHGPSSFWRVFRNLQKRLLSFIKKQGFGDVMPSVEAMHRLGRMDLVYGVALHGGVMVVARRMGLEVRYPERKPVYWEEPVNVQRELENIMRTQPLEARSVMPTSVLLVQAGRADLATAVRDHGGWLYYAQRLGLRFAFEVRKPGFWQSSTNVLRELKNYVNMRYGYWEHPGKVDMAEAVMTGDGWSPRRRQYIPSLEMLKRDGRSDIAFAVERYHGGMEAFAAAHCLIVAEDVVQIKSAEELMDWAHFAGELDDWIQTHGANGIMPTKQDLIRTGRHDLRYAMYRHGGALRVSQRLQLVFAGAAVEKWLPQWLGMQAGKLGLAVQLRRSGAGLSDGSRNVLANLEDQLRGRVLGKHRLLTTEKDILQDWALQTRMCREVSFARARACGRGAVDRDGSGASDASGSSDKLRERNGKISTKELEALRDRYKHLPPDDIVVV